MYKYSFYICQCRSSLDFSWQNLAQKPPLNSKPKKTRHTRVSDRVGSANHQHRRRDKSGPHAEFLEHL